jgi:hypothetical protein
MAISWAIDGTRGVRGEEEMVVEVEDSRIEPHSNHDQSHDQSVDEEEDEEEEEGCEGEGEGDVFEQGDSHVRFSESESEQERGNMVKLGFIHEGNTYAVPHPSAKTSTSGEVTSVEPMGLDKHFVLGAQIVGPELQVCSPRSMCWDEDISSTHSFLVNRLMD